MVHGLHNFHSLASESCPIRSWPHIVCIRSRDEVCFVAREESGDLLHLSMLLVDGLSTRHVLLCGASPPHFLAL